MTIIPTAFTQYRVVCWNNGMPGSVRSTFSSREEVTTVALEETEEKTTGPAQASVVPKVVPTVKKITQKPALKKNSKKTATKKK